MELERTHVDEHEIFKVVILKLSAYVTMSLKSVVLMPCHVCLTSCDFDVSACDKMSMSCVLLAVSPVLELVSLILMSVMTAVLKCHCWLGRG